MDRTLYQILFFFRYLSGGLHQGPCLWLPGPYNWSLRNTIGKLSVPSISKEFLDLGNFDTTTSATTVTGTNTVHINYGRYIWITPLWKLAKIKFFLFQNQDIFDFHVSCNRQYLKLIDPNLFCSFQSCFCLATNLFKEHRYSSFLNQ